MRQNSPATHLKHQNTSIPTSLHNNRRGQLLQKKNQQLSIEKSQALNLLIQKNNIDIRLPNTNKKGNLLNAENFPSLFQPHNLESHQALKN